MDNRTKIAAAWWARELREKHQGTATSSTENSTEEKDGVLSEQQLEDFEAALAGEIGVMLSNGLTNVLAVNHRFAAPQFSNAAARSGIEGIIGKLPSDTVMRIFPDTVMAHRGPQSQVEIVWSGDDRLSGSQNSSA